METQNFVKVAEVGDIGSGEAKRVEVDGEEIALFNVDGNYYAISDVCTHEEASLSEGCLQGEIVSCPRHGARFNIRTGQVLSLPAILSVAAYRVRVEGSDILLSLPED